MLAASPVSEYVVAVEPVLDTRTDQVEPLSVDLSIWYPMITEPPLSLGADQERFIWVAEMAVAVRAVGKDGTTLNVVADAVRDG